MKLLNRWLAQLIRECEAGQKSNAWHQAQHLAQLCPDQLADLPQMLTAAMKERNK